MWLAVRILAVSLSVLFCVPDIGFSQELRAVPEDDLSTGLRSYRLEKLVAMIDEAAKLPGGDQLPAIISDENPVWIRECSLGIDNAYSGEGTRYLALHIVIGNSGQKSRKIARSAFELHADQQEFVAGEWPEGFGPGQIVGIHFGGTTAGQLLPPESLEIKAGHVQDFWCIFAGLDRSVITPQFNLHFTDDDGEAVDVDVSALMAARLGATSERLGPSDAVAHITIHGQLNSVNAVNLASKLDALKRDHCERILISFAPTATDPDNNTAGWLLEAGEAERRSELYQYFPTIPLFRRIMISQLPEKTVELLGLVDGDGIFYDDPAAATMALLADVFPRLNSEDQLKELRSGHPWSRRALLLTVGSQLGSEAIPLLMEIAGNQQQEAHLAAVTALCSYPPPVGDQQFDAAVATGNADEIHAALKGYLSRQTRPSLEAVRTIWNQTAWPVNRQQLVELMGQHYTRTWAPLLLEAAHHGDAEVRVAALRTLFKVGHERLDAICIAALHDPQSQVQQEAFAILVARNRRTSTQAARDFAVEQLKSGHFDEPYLELMESSREIRAAQPILDQFFIDSQNQQRLLHVLTRIGSLRQFRELLERRDEFDANVQAEILGLAVFLPNSECLEYGRVAADSQEPSIRNTALELLNHVGTDDALMVMASMLPSAQEQELIELCQSLGRFGTDRALRILQDYQSQLQAKGEHQKLPMVAEGIRTWWEQAPGYDYVRSGNYYYQVENWEDSRKSYSMAIHINPGLAAAYTGRGSAYLRLDDFDAAGKDFQKALELSPENGQAITGIALVWTIQGKLQEAQKLVEEKAELFHGDRVFAYNTACVYGRAIEWLQKQDATAKRDASIKELQGLAIARLQQSVEEGFTDFPLMEDDPDLQTLKDLPEFQAIISAHE